MISILQFCSDAGRLFNLNAGDANVPIEAEEGVLLRTHAVGEIDCGAV